MVQVPSVSSMEDGNSRRLTWGESEKTNKGGRAWVCLLLLSQLYWPYC
jgi:hypothetical protein